MQNHLTKYSQSSIIVLQEFKSPKRLNYAGLSARRAKGIKTMTSTCKRVNTKQLAKKLGCKWHELDVLRQTVILALADDCAEKGMNDKQTETYIRNRIEIVLGSMFGVKFLGV